MLKKSLFALLLGTFAIGAIAAESSVLAFYNVENMFDHIDDPHTNDAEFTPNGRNRWTEAKSTKKIQKISEVIQKMSAPDLIGLAEVENAYVLDKLIKETAILDSKYSYVHFDSPDERGIDVALMYKTTAFSVISSKVVTVDISAHSKRPTRDILHVEGNLRGEKVHILVNHWSSRSGGQAASNPQRAVAAQTAKMVIGEINKADPFAKVILMGDLNDNPTDVSLVRHLGAKNIKTTLMDNDLFNPYFSLFKKGYGSNTYQDVWHNFDQILISNNFFNNLPGWKFIKADVFNRKFLIEQQGRYKGSPLRTINDSGSIGYSDHLPAYILLER